MTTRQTPRFDALVAALQERGSKIALARELVQETGCGLQSAKNRVHRISTGHTLPNGEDTLLLLDFITRRRRRRA